MSEKNAFRAIVMLDACFIFGFVVGIVVGIVL